MSHISIAMKEEAVVLAALLLCGPGDKELLELMGRASMWGDAAEAVRVAILEMIERDDSVNVITVYEHLKATGQDSGYTTAFAAPRISLEALTAVAQEVQPRAEVLKLAMEFCE